MTLDELRQRRIGLLLSGGGAKGAYQIGCWRALRELGLDRFAAIAGSSVGAMNAVLIGSGRMDKAESAWADLRSADVFELTFRRCLLIPLWILAALGSEFSPFKLTRFADTTAHEDRAWRYAYPVCCLLGAGLLLSAASWVPPGVRPILLTLAIGSAVAGVLSVIHEVLRPVFLSPVLTSNAPLARTLHSCSDEMAETLKKRPTPVYGVLSAYRPRAAGTHLWGGWAPSYVRLDGMDGPTMRQTLLDGSAVPGFCPAGKAGGSWVLDGSWTDNFPAAPLMFGDQVPPLEVLLVVSLKKNVRYRPRHNSLCDLLLLPARDRLAGDRPDENLMTWSARRWYSYRHTNESPIAERKHAHAQPLIVTVGPSRRVGNFLTGTLWFSPAKARRLMELGEEDMKRAIAQLIERAPEIAPEISPDPGTDPDKQVAAFGLASS